MGMDKIIFNFEDCPADCENVKHQALKSRTNRPRNKDQITEHDAAALYKVLRASIQDWVEERFGKALANRVAAKEKVDRQYARDFLKIISPSVRDAMKHPGTDLHIISSTILRFLCTEVLDLWFYCPSSETKFLKELEESLSKLRSHQDPFAIGHWRSEALTAYVHLPSFASKRELWAEVLTTRLTDMLSIFDPHMSTFELQTSVRRHLIDPTFKLAHGLHLSADKYAFDWDLPPHEERDDIKREEGASIDKLAKFELLNIESSSSVPCQFSLTPSMIVRWASDNLQAPMKLVKATVLVVGNKYDDIKVEEGTDMSAVLAKDATVVGWLEDHVAHPHRHYGGSNESH